MSLPTDSEPQAPPHRQVPTRTFPSLLLSGLERARGAATSRPTPTAESAAQPSFERNAESRHAITFADLVLQILQQAPGTPEHIFGADSDSHLHVPHVQIEGKKVWEDFQNHALVLEKDLQKFQDAVQALGSSLNLIRATRDMREQLSLISRTIQENARLLFPRASIPHRIGPMGTDNQRRSRSVSPAVNARFSARRNVEDRPLYVDLRALAEGVTSLRLALEQFPEFGETEVWPLVSFESDLKYWSSNLKNFEGQFESLEVQSYIHDLSRELGAQFEDTSLCLREFTDGMLIYSLNICVPTVRIAQKHMMANLQNLATIATFFSAVTATTLQYSVGDTSRGISNAVNVFWFNSLVFSIASALYSFLVLTWRRANYSSPQLRIPWWLWLWIRQCPTIFLLVSVVTFLAGLGCFTISSRQADVTSVIVIISEAVSAFGLAALLVWLAYDKWSFSRQWDNHLPLFASPGSEKNIESAAPSPAPIKESMEISVRKSEDFTPESTPPIFRAVTAQNFPKKIGKHSESARKRWGLAIERVFSETKERRREKGREILESLHMDIFDPYLQKLVVGDGLPRLKAGADTSDVQFDSQGESLAVCGKSQSMRYELNSGKIFMFPHRIGQARQIVWAPSGEYLMTRTSNAIHVWTLADARQSIIARNETRYILSVPNSEVPGQNPLKVVSVEGKRTNKLALIGFSGEEYMIQEFQDVSIQHIDITPDGTRLLIAAINTHNVEGIQPTRASPGYKLMVFNLETQKVEHQVPLWYDVHFVTISANGKWAVVTYKDYPPPQLWRLRRDASGVQLSLERQFCARERASVYEFDSTQHVRFIGRGHFLNSDRYILCTTADGKIHIWRRDKAHPVHVHGGLTLDKDKPMQIACNAASNNFMFATRSHDGTVRIWRIHDAPTIQINTPGVSGLSAVEAENSEPVLEGIFVARGPLTESPQLGLTGLPMV